MTTGSTGRGPDRRLPEDEGLWSLGTVLAERIQTPRPEKLPAKFDPLDPGYGVADWLRFGLPPRPSGSAALALWREMVTPSVTMQRARLGASTAALQALSRATMRHSSTDEEAASTAASLPRTGRLGSSQNWSGAALIARRGERFVQTIGTWTVPEARPGIGPGPFVCSTWIGIDGLRRWMSSMPQMGTTQVNGETGDTYNDGTPVPKYFAWFQWWLRGKSRQVPVIFTNTDAAIAPGDKVYCAVTRLPADQPEPGHHGKVQFALRVNRAGFTVYCEAPPSKRLGDEPVPARGGSAQWILERPTALSGSPNEHVQEGELFPLPRFHTFGPDRFAAALALDPPGIGVDPTVEVVAELDPALAFRNARVLRMVERREGPTQSAVIAHPTLSSGRLTVRYKA